jgi:hypothetical protein
MPPSTRMIFIGILFDTQKLTIAIDENRLTEIRLLVECWMHKMMASKKELQSLLGKLNVTSSDFLKFKYLWIFSKISNVT